MLHQILCYGGQTIGVVDGLVIVVAVEERHLVAAGKQRDGGLVQDDLPDDALLQSRGAALGGALRFFRTGSCGVYVTDEAEKQEFYWATKEIVSGDYEGAVTRLMKLAENCPSHIFDNAGVFTSEKGAEIDSALAACNAEISVLVTSNSTGTANQELLQSYFDRHYTGTNGTMLLIDTVSKTVTAVSDGEIPQKLSTAVSKANTLAAKGEYEAAIKTITDAMGGTEA